MKSRAITIRQSLIAVQVAGILGLGLLLLSTTFVGTRDTVGELLDGMMRRTMDHVVRELYSFFGRTGRAQEMASEWIESGVLDLSDAEAVHRLGRSFMEIHPEIHAFVLTTAEGTSHRIDRSDDGWQALVIRPRPEGVFERRLYVWNRDGRGEASPWSRAVGDPRDQDWFREALSLDADGGGEDDRFALARLYVGEPQLKDEARLSVSTALASEAPDGRRLVVAFEQDLGPLVAFTRQIAFSERGGVFLVDFDNRILAIPHGEEFWPGAPGGWRLLSPTALGSPVISDLLATLDPNDPLEHALRFRSGGESWWAMARAVPLGRQRGLVAALVIPDAELFAQRHRTRRWIVGSTLLALLLAITASVVVARLLSRPIEKLVQRSHRLRRGDLAPEAAISSPLLEVKSLVSAQEDMRRGLSSLLKLEGDLRLARQIQQATLPDSLPSIPGYELAAWSQPADETGGDTYDVVKRNREDGNQIVHLLVADASGHGVGPALAVTQIRAMLRMAIRLETDLSTMVRHLNEQLHADLPRNRFITAWMGELHPDTHTLRMISAGQGPLLHYRAASDEVHVFPADIQPFGMFPRVALDGPRSFVLEPGDCFVVLSDGFFEAEDEARGQIGRERICATVRGHVGEGASHLLEELRREVESFEPAEVALDDRTALILRRAAGS